ncbi:hypothetical protein INT47_007045 [Mucor saturninus]|uniref:Carbohydrate kinase PfkB domain-containing protein n=1 Tax=Mucor saturninus TaxID=64648 RepID=A0A8H7UZ38_9FUNG|nr:hypothetical protein INT47_007045 [Mucor saturninus]
MRANSVEQRIGGNTCNTAQVLTQFDHMNVCYMSAAGSRETSRDDSITPSSTIIHNELTGSRTILSHNDIQDITCAEFRETFNHLNIYDNWWVHFEGRNISETVFQIDWLSNKATDEGWRRQLVISVELEKPLRDDIECLIPRADIVFFSKIFAQHHGFKDAISFLKNWDVLNTQLKPSAKAFCTWGEDGAAVLDNETKTFYHAPVLHKIEKVIDTVGAGDTFNAGIISCLSRNGQDIKSATRYACTLATNKVAQKGFDGLSLI